ncbi:MAG: hypothetical protein ACRD1K_02740 [Acidimicrobiales bacterium]
MAALGGTPIPCLAILAAWRVAGRCPEDFLADLRPLAVESPPPEVCEAPDWLAGAQWVPARSGLAPEDVQRVQAQWARRLLVSLPPPLLGRLALGSVLALERRWEDHLSRVRSMGRLELLPRARCAVVDTMMAWWGDGPFPPADVDCRMIGRDEKRSLVGRIDRARGQATVELPLSWLVEVWARGLAVVEGGVVLDVAGDRAEVVRWQRTTPFAAEAVADRARLRRDDRGEWHLGWP